MARVFNEARWCINRENGAVSGVEVSGTVGVTDLDGDRATQEFHRTDPWLDLPAPVRQEIADAWDAYRSWLEQRRTAREI